MPFQAHSDSPVGGAGIDRIGGYWQSAGGANIDLNGDAPGAVAVALSSLPGWTPGATYRVTFALSGNPDRLIYAPGAGPATLRVTGQTASTRSLQIA